VDVYRRAAVINLHVLIFRRVRLCVRLVSGLRLRGFALVRRHMSDLSGLVRGGVEEAGEGIRERLALVVVGAFAADRSLSGRDVEVA
jgi:hypothetical protein